MKLLFHRFAVSASLCVLAPAAVFSQPAGGGHPYPGISAVPGEKIQHSPDPMSGYRWVNPSADDGLEIYILPPVSVETDNPENAVPSGGDIEVCGPCNIMIDFGQVNAAWLEFDCTEEGLRVEVSISEYNEPGVFNIGSQHPRKTAQPVRYGNTYRLELNDDLYEGVRFAWIHVLSLDQPVTLRSPRLVCQTKPANYLGRFACSDTTLTRIWYTGAYTVKLNLLEDYFGAILMERSDRHSWTGDAHTSQAASMVAFGNYDFVRKNLRYTSTQYNGIASYSLYWVLSLIDYYNYSGDAEFLHEMTDNACSKLDTAYAHFGTSETVFYGWDERLGDFIYSPAESHRAYMMLSIRSWNEFADAMDHSGRTDLSARYRGYAEEKARLVRVRDTEWWAELGVHAASDAVSAGFMTPQEMDQVWETAFSDRMQRLSYSPFNQYFIIGAMARMGRHDQAVTTVDDCWGGQLRYGATTFFEVYRPSWNDISAPNDPVPNNQCGYTSLTHPWSAGVTKWLTEEVLGVKPTSPGFRTFSVGPHLSSRIRWVEGDAPLTNGTISFALHGDSGEFSLTVPDGTTATLAIPKAGRGIKKVVFRGRKPKPTFEDDEYIYFAGIPGGEYTGTVKWKRPWPETAEEPFRYASTSFTEDTATKGDWPGKYGSRGYMLFNFDTLSYRRSLPPRVKEIRTDLEGNARWDFAGGDTRALQAPEGGYRSLGGIYTQDPLVCRQSVIIDIDAERGFRCEVSLYFVDFANEARRSAIEIFDLETLQLLMPVHMVRDYTGGKYITFPVTGPVRIRLNQVRGPNAVLSGIFFD